MIGLTIPGYVVSRETMMRVAKPIELNSVQRLEVQRLARSKTTSVRLAKRAQIVLLAAAGMQNQQIAERIGVGRVQAGRWRDRYAAGGVAAIAQDRPRGGRVARIDATEIVRVTTQVKPPKATHWSTRTLGKQLGVSDTTVQRVWRQHGLKPHLIEGHLYKLPFGSRPLPRRLGQSRVRDDRPNRESGGAKNRAFSKRLLRFMRPSTDHA